LQDVLANVPSVNVDADGSVSMRGNSNIKFLINGKPSSILGITDDSNALKNIPADQIEKIEVITNPSSKYEASGTAGILNIVLKKSKGLGFNGSVEGSVGYLPQSRLNTNLSWNYGKLSWFVNGGGGFGKFENKSKTYSNDTGNADISDINSINTNHFKNLNFNTGLNYNFTDFTSANFSVTTNANNSDNESNSTTTSTKFGNSSRDVNGEGDNNSVQLDAGLEHKLDSKGQILSASGSFQKPKTIILRTLPITISQV
jgi:outer membrane receptor for ferrienterochelin and colicin